jgi:hypothetical protein
LQNTDSDPDLYEPLIKNVQTDWMERVSVNHPLKTTKMKNRLLGMAVAAVIALIEVFRKETK